jgi:histidinol-phosphate aminotransferase
MTDELLGLTAPGVAGLQPYVPGKPLEDLAREYGIRDAIKLASNENPLGPSPKALGAIRAALPDLARYPEGGGVALKAALAARLGVAPAQLTLGNGSNEILELMARTFVTPADEVIFAEHAFAVYPIVTQAAGARAVVVPARDYGHDLPAMARAVTARTKLIFLANPNNPTGTWFGREALAEFLAAVPRRVPVVLDEAYCDFVADAAYPNGVDFLAAHPNLVVTRTFSKAYGLAGLRIGFGVSSGSLAALLNRVRQPFNVNQPAQAAALAALDDAGHLRKTLDNNARGMAQLVAGFEALGLPYIPSAGNFVCVEVGEAGRCYEALLRAGVIVRPVANYGLPRHLRVTVGLPEENARFLKALGETLAGAPR